MTTAVIMAGGRSERMRASSGHAHKALARVGGISLLEWNLHAVLSSGIRDVVLAVSAREPELREFALATCTGIAESCRAAFEVVSEVQPLGTIGVARQLRGRCDALLVVNVDNLSALDLAALVQHHRHAAAAMTIATHLEPFRIPFGEVIVSHGCVESYLEKSSRDISICSGTCVLGDDAMQQIPAGIRFDVPDLFHTLTRRGKTVAAFHHDTPWIDINDASALERAGRFILDHADRFAFPSRRPASKSPTTAVAVSGEITS